MLENCKLSSLFQGIKSRGDNSQTSNGNARSQECFNELERERNGRARKKLYEESRLRICLQREQELLGKSKTRIEEGFIILTRTPFAVGNSYHTVRNIEFLTRTTIQGE